MKSIKTIKQITCVGSCETACLCLQRDSILQLHDVYVQTHIMQCIYAHTNTREGEAPGPPESGAIIVFCGLIPMFLPDSSAMLVFSYRSGMQCSARSECNAHVFLSHRNAMFIPDSSAMIVFFVSHRNAMFLPDPSARVITCIHVLLFKFDNDITPYMLNIVIIIYVRMCVFMTCVTMQKNKPACRKL